MTGITTKANFGAVLWHDLNDVWRKVMIDETHYYDEEGVLQEYGEDPYRNGDST